MSNKINQELYEDLIVWLGERGFKGSDIQKDRHGHFVFGNEKKVNDITLKLPLYLPDAYQELLC